MNPIWALVIYTITPDGVVVGAQPWKHFEDFGACQWQVVRMTSAKKNPNLFPACVLAREVK